MKHRSIYRYTCMYLYKVLKLTRFLLSIHFVLLMHPPQTPLPCQKICTDYACKWICCLFSSSPEFGRKFVCVVYRCRWHMAILLVCIFWCVQTEKQTNTPHIPTSLCIYSDGFFSSSFSFYAVFQYFVNEFILNRQLKHAFFLFSKYLSDSLDTIKVIIIKLGMVTAWDMRMHQVLIILTLTFIQGHTDLIVSYTKCSIISETFEAMPIKFALKIIRLKVYKIFS